MRSHPKRYWFRFVLLGVLGALWALATPLFASPDEPSHVAKAASVVRGQFLPDKIPGSRLQYVAVPQRLTSGQQAADCTKFQPDQDASCIDYHGSGATADVTTAVGRYPPVVYAVAGLPTLLSTGVFALYAMRLLFVALMATCVAWALGDVESLAGPAAKIGVFAAVTPMVLFLSGTVNPNAAEISLAIVVWTGALRLIRQAGDRPLDGCLVNRLGATAALLVLCRPLSPLWLIVIGIVVYVLSGSRTALRALLRSTRVRAWMGIVTIAGAFQTGWVVFGDPVYGDAESATSWSLSETLRISIGRLSIHLRDMIGVFGWTDTPAPELTRVVLLGVFGLLILAAMALGDRRVKTALALLAVSCIVIPVASEVNRAAELGVSWHGRYTLPLACGLLILSGVSIADGRLVDSAVLARFARPLAVLLAIAEFAAFYQLLRRYSVGIAGPISFFTNPDWSPPVPSWLLLLANVAVVGALIRLEVVPSPREQRGDR